VGSFLAGGPNVKVDGHCQETYWSLCTSGDFEIGVCMLNGNEPIGNTDETLQNMYEETQARLEKINYDGYEVIDLCVSL